MSKPRLVVATLNPGKLAELARAFGAVGFEVSSLEALSDRTPIEETGASFEENARLKAEGYSRRTDLAVLADDSGLEVDALRGAPGVESARWGGPDLDDRGRNQKLLRSLEGVPPERRSARFRCVLAVARSGRCLASFEGTVEGRILDAPSGEGGFGYDPLFYHPASGRTFAELSTEEKQRVSHRGLAVAALLEALRRRDPRLAGLG